MSLILDALRKSERTRQQTLTGQVSATGSASQHARIPVPWATLIGILLVINAVVLVIILLRTHTGHSTPTAAEIRIPVKASPASPPIPVYHPEVRSLAAEAAASISGSPAATPVESMTASPVSMGTQALAATSMKTPAPVSTPAAAAGASLNGGSVASAPTLDSLPPSFQQALPPLHLDVHAYARNPAERFVIINMQRYHIGDTLKEGPKIVDIVPQGVILDYKGQRFLLPRL